METEQVFSRRRDGLPFRPSYEGWKLRHGAPGFEGESAFRPSYEGWKLVYFLNGVQTPYLLLDLPMRDGN